MDVSKTRQKYEQYTCLCFSVMGQRRFRVSMGVLLAPPEAGDATINIMPQMKKHTTTLDDPSKSFISTISERNTTNQNALMSTTNNNSTNSINENGYKHMILMNNSTCDKMSSSTIYDSCQFPYYRSNRSDNKCTDAVLVKDVGVSCMLLNQNESELPIPETKTLVKHLKKEYNDLSNITSKITAYTKDILNHLSKKSQRKHQLLKNLVASKHAIASQYVDSKGNLCLKLRLLSNAETQCSTQEIVDNFDSKSCKDKHVTQKLHNKHSKKLIPDKDQIKVCNENTISKNEKYVQTISDQENAETNTSNSTSPSASSICKYLTIRRKKISNELVNPKVMKSSNMHLHGNSNKFVDNKNCHDKYKKHSPVIFTNWKEVSKSKQSKPKTLSITSHESQQTANAKNKILQKEFINFNTVNNIPDTRFHTVNIRIIKKNTRNV